MAKTPTATTPTPTATTAPVTKTVQGFAVGLTAFIPVDQKDLRKQAEIPLLLLDIQEGKKTLADLAPYLKQIDFRQQHVRKRVTEDEYSELFQKAEAAAPEADQSQSDTGSADEAEDSEQTEA